MASKQPKKQRKAVYQSPLHRRRKMLVAPLSPQLRGEYGVRNLPVRKGDTVLIMRGDHIGVEGKVVRVDTKKFKIFIEGVKITKADGSERLVPIHPSKVMITKLDLSDSYRKQILERKKAGRAALQEAVEEAEG